jgi:hypothetical protein
MRSATIRPAYCAEVNEILASAGLPLIELSD